MTAGLDADFAPEAIEAGRKLFAGPCDFFFAAAKSDGLPPIGAPEIAFAGRSNVGKSSLINALTGRTTLARTSNTPGRTQELIFFALGDRLTLVDMPGYGYAAVGKAKSATWVGLIRDYLRGRPSLMRAFVLVDGRRGIKDSDEATMTALDKTAVSYAIVLTKRDEVKAADQPALVAATLEALRKRPAAYPNVFFTSAHTGEGVPELRAHVAAAAGRARPVDASAGRLCDIMRYVRIYRPRVISGFADQRPRRRAVFPTVDGDCPIASTKDWRAIAKFVGANNCDHVGCGADAGSLRSPSPGNRLRSPQRRLRAGQCQRSAPTTDGACRFRRLDRSRPGSPSSFVDYH